VQIFRGIQSGSAGGKAGRLAFYDFRRARSDCRSASWIFPKGCEREGGFYFVPAKDSKEVGAKIEARLWRRCRGDGLYYAGPGRTSPRCQEDARRATECGDAVFAKKCLPYVAMVDAGTVEQVRGSGREGGELGRPGAEYEPAGADEQLESHPVAGAAIDRIVARGFQHAAKNVREKKTITEYDLKV